MRICRRVNRKVTVFEKLNHKLELSEYDISSHLRCYSQLW